MGDKLSLQQWIDEATVKNLTFSQFCLDHHAGELQISAADILERMQSVLMVMRESIDTGLSGIRSVGGLVGGDSLKLKNHIDQNSKQNIVGDAINLAIIYALAVGEANASMGRIVAAPTAGSSGVVPAVLFALEETQSLTTDQLSRALVVSGAIGMVIASRASLSGAAGGCQAECGSAAAMAAGAAVDMLGGTPEQVGHAVAIVLKNMLGLVCDPVAGLVEVPCVKRNAGAATQALVAAQMALAGINSFIPVDEVIDAMSSVGSAMHCSLKETAQGGLAVTPTALEWAKKLFGS